MRSGRRSCWIGCCRLAHASRTRGVIAPLWTFYIAWSQPREILDRGDVAKVNEYLARTDRNDFVMSNLLADGPIQAAFGRHAWPALDDSDEAAVHLELLTLFEKTGSERIHALIFTRSASRSVDRSLVQIIPSRRLPSIHGWPQLARGKVSRIVEAYDRRVLANLAAVGAAEGHEPLELRRVRARSDRRRSQPPANRSPWCARSIWEA